MGMYLNTGITDIHETDMATDLVVDGETNGCERAFVTWETLLIEMVERILLLQLE